MSSSNVHNKIVAALDSAVKLSLDGASPNNSIIKSARDHSLTPEMTCRVVEAYNIAKTRAYLKTAKDKTEPFPVANKSEILQQVFGGDIFEDKKTAALIEEKPDIWSSDLKVDIGNPTGAKFQKWAEAPQQNPVDVDSLIRQARAQDGIRKIAIDKARVESLRLERSVTSNIAKLTTFLSYTKNRQKFAEFEAEVLSEHGDEGFEVLGFVVKQANLEGVKRQAASKYANTYFPTLEYRDQVNCISDIIDSRRLFNQQQEKIAILNDIANEQKGTIDSLMERIVMGPDYIPQHKKSANSLVNTYRSSIPSASSMLTVPEKKSGSVFSMTTGEMFKTTTDTVKKYAPTNLPELASITSGQAKEVSQDYSNASVDELRKSRTTALKPKDVEEVNNLRRQVILQDLIVNDEILKNEDPRLVQEAYNSLLRINPSATLIPEVTRSVLRNTLGRQVLDVFTANEMAKFESMQEKNKIVSRGGKASKD